MKQWFSIVFASIFGGLFVLGGSALLKTDKTESDQNLVHQVNYTNQSPTAISNSMPNSFVMAAEKATPVVVSIKAEESETLAQQRFQKKRKEPRTFEDLFRMDDIFGGSPFSQFYRQQGAGSGVIYSSDGYIVTNNHVVGFADKITVTLSDQRVFTAKKVGTDPSSDLAVLKIEATDLPTMELANSDDVQVGEWVLAVGNPFEYLTSTVTAGIVSAKGRDIDIIKEAKTIEEFIQTDAAINPGNSGGALVDTKGKLLGINTAIATPTGSYAGYSFAIPSNVVKRIVKDIIENGDIERANLGVSGYNVDETLKEEYKITTDSGFYVFDVVSGSAAEFGGILPGDVITRVGETEVKSFDDLSSALKFGKVGDELTVYVVRKGKEKKIKVRLRKSL